MEIERSPHRKIVRRTKKSAVKAVKPPFKKTAIIISLIFIIIIAIVVVISLYFAVWQDLWRPVITVNEETVNMDYLIRRIKYVDRTDDILAVLYETIPYEMLIRQGAPRYNIDVTTDEVDELLWEMAQGGNETFSETEFKYWYRNELNETKLTNAEYRELIYTQILAERLNDHLIENIPTVAEQVHLYIIALNSYEDAEAAKARIEEGEEFSDLARELSIDSESGGQGGDFGWWPENTLQTSLETMVFNLEIGQISNPILMDEEEGIYFICTVMERQIAREIEEDKLGILKDVVLEEWLNTERIHSTILFSGMDWSEIEQRYVFGSLTMAWLSVQLAKE